MKTLGRIILILLAFALVMGLAYVLVKVGGPSAGTAASAFGRDAGFSRPDGVRLGFRGERDGRGGGWMFGMIKNVGIIALIVALVVIPKNIGRRRIRNIPAGAD